MVRHKHIFFKITVALTCLLFFPIKVWSGQEPDKWNTAGKEISEAAKAVGNASEESWQKTKETTAKAVHGAKETGTEVWDQTKQKSSEVATKTVEVTEDVAAETAEKSKGFWQKIQETSKKWYTKAKAKIHQMTAPDGQQ